MTLPCNTNNQVTSGEDNNDTIERGDPLTTPVVIVSSITMPDRLYRLLKLRANLAWNTICIGTMVAESNEGPHFIHEDFGEDESSANESGSIISGIDSKLDDDIATYEIFTSGVEAQHPGGVDMAHLLKGWCISHDDAKQTLEVTSLHSVWTQELTLLQNYRTNDCMLHYKRIKDYFFMNTFFTTSKGGKSSHGNTCCQLFVTDKGFIYIVPLKQKSEVLLEVKQFAKESGAPDAILCDMVGEQLTQEIKHSCNTIGTTLRALEEGMPWSNMAELYIKLMKESVRKDMKSPNSPLSFWDYCLKRRVCICNLMAHDHIKECGSNPHTITAGDKAIFLIYVAMGGMSGATFMSTPPTSHTIRKFAVEFLALPEGKGMRCPSGC